MIPAGTTVWVVDEIGATFAFEEEQSALDLASTDAGDMLDPTVHEYVTLNDHESWDDVADEAACNVPETRP